MSDTSNKKPDEMLSHYDFSHADGVRGKHAERYRQGVTVHLIDESKDSPSVQVDDEDKDWKELAAREFLRGYTEEDAAYENYGDELS